MPSNTATLFISAVTDEFKSYRDAVAKWLEGPGVRIETQEKFIALGKTTLVKLSDYIHECDAVVHLVGDRTGNESGSVANAVAVQSLLEAHRDLPHSLGLTSETINRLTYTQWEAWLAIYHNKRLFIAVPEATAPRDKRLEDEAKSNAQLENQKVHLAALAERGRYPEVRFANSDKLCLGLMPLRDIFVRGARNELGLSNILSLSDYRASLAGFRRFLSSSNLPFRAPSHGNPCHPEELLKSLETSLDAKGVLLAGAGGVGKTRTTFETAQLADAAARSELQQLTEHVAQRLRLLTLDSARRGNLPWPNANFVGREPELASLRAALLDAPEPSPAGIHGVGGMGKTALAQAFAYKEADAFPGGCWLLRCEGRDRLLSVFRNLVNDLEIELTDEEKLDDAKAVRRVFDVLRARGPALFLLDNVDCPALLTQEQMKLLADQPWARVLYTTRLAPDAFTRASAMIRPLDLDRLPENQAVDLIRHYQPEQAFASSEHEAAARESFAESKSIWQTQCPNLNPIKKSKRKARHATRRIHQLLLAR